MLKAFYGLFKSSILFYNNLVKCMEYYWLKNNPYNPCVANSIINGHQITVTLYVDYLKVSHKYPFHTTKFPCYLSSISVKELMVKELKVYDYLVMYLDFSEMAADRFLRLPEAARGCLTLWPAGPWQSMRIHGNPYKNMKNMKIYRNQ